MAPIADATDAKEGEPPPPLIASAEELAKRGEYARALTEIDVLMPRFPTSFAVLSLAVLVTARLQGPAAAEKYAHQAVMHHPHMAAAHFNLGITLRAQGKIDEALIAYGKAVELNAKLDVAHYHRGLMLEQKGDVNGAINAFDRVIQLDPDHADAHFHRGSCLTLKGEHKAAIEAYSEVVRLRPNAAEAHNNRGVVYLSLMELDAAVAALENAIRLKPDFAAAYDNLGTVLAGKECFPDAVRAFDKATALDPNLISAAAQKLFIQARICDFTSTPGVSAETVGDEVTPFWVMSLQDSPERQLRRAAYQWKRRVGAIRPLPLPARRSCRPDRIRVGYFSSDIHEHATLYLTLGLFREHDRSRFDIFVYSYGLGKEGASREKLMQAGVGFHDIEPLSAGETVSFVRSHDLDIAIDLKGYTSGTRSELFGYRLAPIQVGYLGYPGTMGTDAMDYIVADSTVIPSELRQYYSESILYLPHTYQPTDNRREIANTSTSRADFGLPEDAFVFCCFNNSYKITAEEFDIWMRVMSRVDGSVLWMISSSIWMEENLRMEAACRGIEPHRLIFSEKIPQAEHLARHRHADLFLDTFNYNAHTTASDALWTSLPLVTRTGRQFSARVAASLLKAMGLPELVTATNQEYEDRILDLATRPLELQEIRKRLEQNRLKQPLFDTVRYTRNFEAGLQLAYDRYFAGEGPCDISVSDRSG